MLSTIHDSRMVPIDKIDHNTERQIMKPVYVKTIMKIWVQLI